MPLTDYHAAIRDAIKDVIAAAYTVSPAVTPTPAVHALDDVDDVQTKSLPCIVVACVGPEQDRPDFGTNLQTGVGYPCLVALMTAGVANGEKSAGAPDVTTFRRQIHVLFNLKRLAAVSQVAYCEVSDAGFLDPKLPAFQRLSTAVLVTAVGRFPRA